MTVGEWLLSANALLTRVGVPTARLDALVLLEDCLGRDRAQLLAHTETEISKEQLDVLNGQLNRRAMHEPLAYIRNVTEFYGRKFYIDHRVLEPRPESETMIEQLKRLLTRQSDFYEVRPKRERQKEWTVIDVGTGSGALAITAKLELPHVEVMATDVDQNALKVAEQNCRNYDCDIHFLKGNLLKPFYMHYHPKHTILLCNLPYVPDSFHINAAAMREPSAAIFGGPDGLDLYRQLFDQIDPLAYKPEYVLTESMPPQHDMLKAIAKNHGYQLQSQDDFILVFAR